MGEESDPVGDAMKHLLMKGDQNFDQFRRDMLGNTGARPIQSEDQGGSYLSYIRSKYGSRSSVENDDSNQSIRSAWQKDFEESKLSFILGTSASKPVAKSDDESDDGIPSMKLPPHKISGGDFAGDTEVQVDNFMLGDDDEDDDHGDATDVGAYLPSGMKPFMTNEPVAVVHKNTPAANLSVNVKTIGYEPVIGEDDDDRVEVVDFADVDITDRVLGAIATEVAESELAESWESSSEDGNDDRFSSRAIKEGGNAINLPVESMDIKAVDSSTHIRTTADAFLEYYLSHINDIQNGANAAADRVGDIEDLDCEDDED